MTCSRRSVEDDSSRLEPGGYSLKTDFGLGSVSRTVLMYPFASLPENLTAFCAVLRRDYRLSRRAAAGSRRGARD